MPVKIERRLGRLLTGRRLCRRTPRSIRLKRPWAAQNGILALDGPFGGGSHRLHALSFEPVNLASGSDVAHRFPAPRRQEKQYTSRLALSEIQGAGDWVSGTMRGKSGTAGQIREGGEERRVWPSSISQLMASRLSLLGQIQARHGIGQIPNSCQQVCRMHRLEQNFEVIAVFTSLLKQLEGRGLS